MKYQKNIFISFYIQLLPAGVLKPVMNSRKPISSKIEYFFLRILHFTYALISFHTLLLKDLPLIIISLLSIRIFSLLNYFLSRL